MNQQNRKYHNNEYAKWSGVVMTGIISIVGLSLLGKYLDKKINPEKSYCTIIGAILGVLYFFYSLISAVIKK